MSELLDIDGSVLEGGGQILRNAISLSAILGIPIRVKNIRAGRKKPGLAAQHLKGIQLVALMCKAQVNGAKIGSTEIEFRPGKITGGKFEADTQTAGSISLLLQVSLPCALLSDGPVSLSLRGGTNADMAPQIDYMTEVFYPNITKFGVDYNLTVMRRGYYPKGGGHVKVQINPVRQMRSVTITERGDVINIQGWSFVAGKLPVKMAYEMAEGARRALQGWGPLHVQAYKEDPNFAPDSCAGIVLACTTGGGVLGADALCGRGAEPRGAGLAAGRHLAAALIRGDAVDTHAQDQLIIYMALAAGTSTIKVGEVTLHTQTAINVAELMTKAKFTIRPEGELKIIECAGIGFINESVTP